MLGGEPGNLARSLEVENMNKIRAFDMFCGGGGSSIGAEAAGALIAGGVDLWKTATDAFKLNFPDASVFNRDLRELSPSAVNKKTGSVEI